MNKNKYVTHKQTTTTELQAPENKKVTPPKFGLDLCLVVTGMKYRFHSTWLTKVKKENNLRCQKA